MTYRIPDKVLASNIAILGKPGAGKTSTEKLIIEQAVDSGARVCILDTIKSDWWGITSSADGRAPGLPFTILGGPRRHVPLHSSAGAAIGKLVAEGALPLSIIDMREFEAGGPQRFFVDFAAALFKHMRGVLHLVIEEAHELAPKERAGIGHETMAIHWAKKLATAGRSLGIRIIVATQRTQSLHNALLDSCETMIAHRLISPASQEPVLKWFKGNADKAKLKTIEESLAQLPTGTAWVFSGEAQIFEKIAFPKFRTFDNSKTPTGDNHGATDVKTAAVDLGALRALIGDAVKDAEANDPEALKAEIAKLKAALERGDQAQRITEDDYREADAKGFSRGLRQGNEAAAAITSKMTGLLGSIAEIAEDAKAFLTNIELPPPAWESPEHMEKPTRIYDNVHVDAAKLEATNPPVDQSVPPANKPEKNRAGGGDQVSPALQRAIDAIAWWASIGFRSIERDRACVVCGLSPRASTFGVYVSKLVEMGLVETSPGKVALTAAGSALANWPNAAGRKELRALASSRLSAAELRVFDLVYEAYPREIRRDDLCQRLGLSPKASTLGVYISKISAYGIIEASAPGAVRAADWLFPRKAAA